MVTFSARLLRLGCETHDLYKMVSQSKSRLYSCFSRFLRLHMIILFIIIVKILVLIERSYRFFPIALTIEPRTVIIF